MHIDFVHLFAHGVVFSQNFVQLFAQIAKEFSKQARIVFDLLNVKLIHNFGQSGKHGAGVVQLGQVHAVENHVRAFGNLLCRAAAKGHNALQIVHLNLACQSVYLRRVDQGQSHLVPVRLHVVLLDHLRFLDRGNFQRRGLPGGRPAEI